MHGAARRSGDVRKLMDGGAQDTWVGGLRRPSPGGCVRHLYVHAPFCPRRCVYCDFAVTTSARPDTGLWLESLAREWAAVASEGRFPLADRLATLYVGGGTPSHLGPSAMEGLAGTFGKLLLSDPELEWTAEANPESFTPDLARAWRKAGVSRVSLGLQTFHAVALRWMGRMHGPEGGRGAVRVARQAGLTNISVDLIFGLPVHLGRSLKRDLDEALRLDVPHISLYGLTVEAGTPLGRAVSEGRETTVEPALYEEEYLYLCERLVAAGYRHYEVSNFARPASECRHNQAYWSGKPYLGLGSSAHSYRHPLRRWNLRDWEAYSKTARSDELPVEGSEILGEDSARLEWLWLGLRTSRGLYRPSLPEGARNLLSEWVGQGWAEVLSDRVRLTARGWLLLDRLVVDLDSRFDA